MVSNLEDDLRSPKGYELGHSALHELRQVEVWPTVLNFELWLHLLAEPESTLALEVKTLLGAGEPITDAIAEDLVPRLSPAAPGWRPGRRGRRAPRQPSRHGRSDHRRGARLGRRLQRRAGARAAVASRRNRTGQRSSRLVDGLAEATDVAHAMRFAWRSRLAESSAEVRKLREALN